MINFCKKKKKAFTLLELIITVAIGSILLLLVTDRIIFQAVNANNTNNKVIDLNTGVKTTIDEINNTLKSSIQVHLVGKTVYNKGADTTKLDKRYNYIALRDITGLDGSVNTVLVNLIYNATKDNFDIIPVTALDKNDSLKKSKTEYTMQFYKNDDDYKSKMDKSILNITVKGKSTDIDDSGKPISKDKNNPNPIREFELTQDIMLPNVNQIMTSKYLEGGLDDITAIAYDNGQIKEVKGKKAQATIVFAIDSSDSMMGTVNGNNSKRGYNRAWAQDYFRLKKSGPYHYLSGKFEFGYFSLAGDIRNGYHLNFYSYNNRTYKRSDIENRFDDFAIRKFLAAEAINNNFLPNLSKAARDNNVDLSAYIFNYDTHVRCKRISPDPNSDYLWQLSDLENDRYGPYRLNTDDDIKTVREYTKSKCELGFDEDNFKTSWFEDEKGSTNTGEGLLQALEILKQLDKEKNIKNRFLVLMTDGAPNRKSVIYPNNDKKNARMLLDNKSYRQILKDYPGTPAQPDILQNPNTVGMDAVKQVATSTSNNYKGLYKKAFIIGFSGIKEEIENIGFDTDEHGNSISLPSESITGYLRSTGNEADSYRAKDYDALNKAFEDINNQIGDLIGVFDGPEEMK